MKLNKYLIMIITVMFFFQINLNAATIVLRSGTALKGKLIERNDEEITVQDPATKQLRIIKTIFVKDIILDPGEEKIVDKKKVEEKPRGKDLMLRGGESDANQLSALDPRLGLLPGVAIPFGKINKALNFGYGFSLFTDLAIPMKVDILQIRPGLSVGFLYHGTKGGSALSFTSRSSYVMMIPVLASFKFEFIAPHGFRPYIKVAGGITPVLAQGQSSFDPTFAPGVGLGYINDKVPYLEFFLEAGVLMAFEKVRGDFITASVGLAYRFGAPQSSTKK